MATETRETVDLIGSDKVEGTAVYDANGERMGTIKRVMLEKRSGQVSYAVLRDCLKSSGCRESTQHQTRHREVNHGLTTLW